MPSQLRSDTARANGAKSHGPKSAETREISSHNSLRHGFTARHIILLECENADEFQKMEDDFAAMHQPATPAEQNLVDEMVAARWRIQRIRTIETVILDCEMIRKKNRKTIPPARFRRSHGDGLPHLSREIQFAWL